MQNIFTSGGYTPSTLSNYAQPKKQEVKQEQKAPQTLWEKVKEPVVTAFNAPDNVIKAMFAIENRGEKPRPDDDMLANNFFMMG